MALQSQNSKGPVEGNSKGSIDPSVSSSASAPESTAEERNRVAEIVDLVGELKITEWRDLRGALEERGYLELFQPPGTRTTSPLREFQEPLQRRPQGSTQATRKVVAKVENREVLEDEGSGATRRTMIRKARKALKDATGNPDATERALLRLRFLGEKYGVPFESLLPEAYDVPKGSSSTGHSRTGAPRGSPGRAKPQGKAPTK